MKSIRIRFLTGAVALGLTAATTLAGDTVLRSAGRAGFVRVPAPDAETTVAVYTGQRHPMAMNPVNKVNEENAVETRRIVHGGRGDAHYGADH